MLYTFQPTLVRLEFCVSPRYCGISYSFASWNRCFYQCRRAYKRQNFSNFKFILFL